MAFELTRDGFQQSFIAASAVLPKQPVQVVGTSVPFVIPAASMNVRPFGVVKATAGASGLNQGETVTVFEETNVVKMVACASVGAAAEVAVASSNGAVGPQTLISASGHWALGITETSADAGEIVSVYIKPRKA
jgi:hypothetical protein